MITFAGIPLCLEDPAGEVAHYLDHYLSLDGLNLFGEETVHTRNDRYGNRGGNSDLISLPVPNYPPRPRPKVNSLYWPTGATRWAQGLFLATDTQKSDIDGSVVDEGRSASSKKAKPAQLVIADSQFTQTITEDGFTVDSATGVAALSTKMWLLPPRMVSPAVGERLWLLPLVDERYFWQFRSTGFHIDIGDSTIWKDIFIALGPALGIGSITYDDPDDEFGSPDKTEMMRLHENAALMLDATAWSIGQRIVRDLDGTVYSLLPETSETRLTDNMSSTWSLVAGSDFNAGPSATAAPEFVDVVFRDLTFRDNSGELPDGGSWETQHGRMRVRKSGPEGFEVAAYTSDLAHTIHTPTLINHGLVEHGDVVDDLAGKIAEHYFAYVTKPSYDATFINLKKWLLTGYDDYVEWSLGHRRSDGSYTAHTRVHSAAYNFGVSSSLAQVGTQCPWTEDIIMGYLLEDLDPAGTASTSSESEVSSGELTDPSTAKGSVFLPETGREGGTELSNPFKTGVRNSHSREEEIVNRSIDAEAPAGTFYIAHRIGCEWVLVWADCG